MAWSGGTYRKGNYSTNGWTGDASLGIGIEAGRHDTQDDDFMNGINQCLNKDGSNSATGNLNIGSNRLTNVAAATARTDAAQVGQVQDGSYIWLGTTGGTATAMTATATPAITSYAAGQKFRMKIGAGLGSTGSSNVANIHTLTINGVTPAKNIVNNEDATNPTIGTWIAGAIMEVIYDGTNFVITNDPGGWLTHSITVTPSAGTATGVTITNSLYRKVGKMVTIDYVGYFTASAGNNFTQFSLPIRPNEIFSAMIGVYFANAVTQVALAQTASPRSLNRVTLATYNSALLAAGTVYFCIGGTYRSE